MAQFDDLSSDDRKQLLKLVCSFAWLDHEVQPEERTFIKKLIEQMNLDEEDRRDAFFWLENKVNAEELGSIDVPAAHRQLFVEVARALIGSDEQVTDDEAQELALLELIAGVGA
ncbi:MAG: TerB family tellurite resistance protein [Myxococcota bacterium]